MTVTTTYRDEVARPRAAPVRRHRHHPDRGMLSMSSCGSPVGIEILKIDARIVIASVDTYLRFAEARPHRPGDGQPQPHRARVAGGAGPAKAARLGLKAARGTGKKAKKALTGHDGDEEDTDDQEQGARGAVATARGRHRQPLPARKGSRK